MFETHHKSAPIIVLSIILFGLFACPASATLINTSVVFADSSLNLIQNAQNGVSAYVYQAPSDYAIVFQTIQVRTENVDYELYYQFGDSSVITGLIHLEPTSLVGGEYQIAFDGGGSSNVGYLKIPLTGVLYAQPRYMVIVSDPDTLNQYMVIADDISGTTSGALYVIDTTKVAYIQLPKKIATNPLTKSAITSATGTMDVLTKSESFADLANAQTTAETTTHSGSWLDMLVGIFQPILKAIAYLDAMTKTIGSFFSIFTIIFAFVFAGQIFIGMNAIYVGIAILLAIEDSDDIFKAFGNFYRRMMKLFRFYMELFRAMKDILKWW